jgi:hypothetical protein
MKSLKSIKTAVFLPFAILVTTACNSNPPQELACNVPQGTNLDRAMAAARFDLGVGCEEQFDAYFQRLLTIAEGDPQADNKAKFSDFLLWANDQGLISKLQARTLYTRYFGIKYVSMQGDYSVCSEACPKKSRVLREMQDELGNKEQGLLKVAADRRSFQRAHRLLQETELVLEATCTSCGPLE